jgi:hypothetical protein
VLFFFHFSPSSRQPDKISRSKTLLADTGGEINLTRTHLKSFKPKKDVKKRLENKRFLLHKERIGSKTFRNGFKIPSKAQWLRCPAKRDSHLIF